MSTTLTRSDLCDTISNEVGLSRQQSVSVLEAVLGEISDNLARTGEVKISSFGTFHVRQKSERVGRNPKTGEEVMITPRKSMSFRASHILKDKMS